MLDENLPEKALSSPKELTDTQENDNIKPDLDDNTYLINPKKTISEIRQKFSEGKILWTGHARQKLKLRNIDRTWLISQVSSKAVQIVTYIWNYGYPEKVLLCVGTPLDLQQPVHTVLVNQELRVVVVTVYIATPDEFEDEGLTRKRRDNT